MIFKDEVHPRPTTATELCAFFLKAWAPIPMACINCLIQYTGDVLLQSTPMKNIYDISYLVSFKSVMYC